MTDAAAELVAPTPERIRKAHGREIDIPQIDTKTSRRSWRIQPVVDGMRRAYLRDGTGCLTDERWEAWERFERDLTRSSMGPRIIAQYGERAGGGGTPAMHMTVAAMQAAEVADERREQATNRALAALRAVAVPRLQQVLVLAVCEDLSLEGIGKRVCQSQDRNRCIAIAGAAIEDALWLLHVHYQNLYGQSQKAP